MAGKQIHVLIDEALLDKFNKALSITGASKTVVISKAIERYVYEYANDKGDVKPKEALLKRTQGIDPETKEPIYGNPEPCIVLNEHPHMPNYMTVYYDGNIMQVPKDHVIMKK